MSSIFPENRNTGRRKRFLPYLVLLVPVGGAFLAATSVPYRVDSDIAFQLNSLEQWLRGDSPAPVVLRLPDPQDLSRNTFVWSNWWPPALPYLYLPFTATGLPLGAAVRAASLLFFLIGCAGFLRFVDDLGLPSATRLLCAVSLAFYGVTLGGAASLRAADILAFAAGPWLALMAWRQDVEKPRSALLFLCGLALGATYWIRYALFLTALPILAWITLRIAVPGRSRARTARARMKSLGLLGMGFALPVVILLALNSQKTSFSESVSGKRSLWNVGEPKLARPPFLLLSLAGAPGLSLFQSDMWITHLTFFSDSRLPALRKLDEGGRLTLKALLGIPGTLALAWALIRMRRENGKLVGFAALLISGFYLELTLVSLFVGYNYLVNEARLAAGFLPLVQCLLLAHWTALPRRPWQPRTISTLGLVLFLFALPSAFAAGNFVKNEIYDRRSLGYTASSTGLFMPEISSRNVPEVQAVVASALRSPRDVVVLAGSRDWGGSSAFVPWLEFPQRTFPVAPFFAPLGAQYLETADVHGSGVFRTTRPLRLVLVISRQLEGIGVRSSLQARFPQARRWMAAPGPSHSEVNVYFTDLKVP